MHLSPKGLKCNKRFPTLKANKSEVNNYTSDALKAKRSKVQHLRPNRHEVQIAQKQKFVLEF